MRRLACLLVFGVWIAASPAAGADLRAIPYRAAPDRVEADAFGRIGAPCFEGAEPLVLRCDPRVDLPIGAGLGPDGTFRELPRTRRRPYVDLYQY